MYKKIKKSHDKSKCTACLWKSPSRENLMGHNTARGRCKWTVRIQRAPRGATTTHPLHIWQPQRAEQHHPSSTIQSSQGHAGSTSSAKSDATEILHCTPNPQILKFFLGLVQKWSFFQPNLTNSSIGKTESKIASTGLVRSALKSNW